MKHLRYFESYKEVNIPELVEKFIQVFDEWKDRLDSYTHVARELVPEEFSYEWALLYHLNSDGILKRVLPEEIRIYNNLNIEDYKYYYSIIAAINNGIKEFVQKNLNKKFEKDVDSYFALQKRLDEYGTDFDFGTSPRDLVMSILQEMIENAPDYLKRSKDLLWFKNESVNDDIKKAIAFKSTEQLIELIMPEYIEGKVEFKKKPPFTIEDVKILVDQGADVNAHDATNNFGSLLMGLIDYNHVENFKIMKYLYSRGARLDEQNSCGSTAVYYAAHYGYYKILKWLIEEGANINISNNTGILPLHTALSEKNISCITLLLKFGSEFSTDNYKIAHFIKEDYKSQKRLIEFDPAFAMEIPEEKIHPDIYDEFKYLFRSNKVWDLNRV